MRAQVRARRVFPFVLAALVTLSVLFGVFVATGAAKRAGIGLGLPTDEPAQAPPAFRSTVDSSVGAVEKLSADAARRAGTNALLPTGEAAPGFSLPAATGEKISLSDYKGRVVLLEFSATASPQCQAEAEHLVAIRAGSSARIVFLSVNADGEDAASVQAFDRHFLVPYPTLLDPGDAPGEPGPVSRSYQVQVCPTFYVIDSSGQVAWRSDGEQPDDLIMKKLAQALGR
ncbi:MAG TPA: TlpA disulfide reductase family protein [Spirochaetia bacterium]|nr:TlpA disulfide reductase family protein [Spirochaetia bacterium]